MKKSIKVMSLMAGSLAGLCVLLAALSAFANTRMPRQSSVTEKLSQADKIRLAETENLREWLGEAVWPGWGMSRIPAILYNESYIFLAGYPEPPDGWVKVPANLKRGGPWELVVQDTFRGASYYRQAVTEGITPEAFVVRVGDRWVWSLRTYEWTRIGLADSIRQDLPACSRPVFPYGFLLSQLMQGDDQFISLSEHEAFHAFQGMSAPGKFLAAEQAGSEQADQYPWEDDSSEAAWRAELNLLADVLRSPDTPASTELARRFLEQRQARRQAAGLVSELVLYEQQREWTEGLARYAELEIWRLAAEGTYTPLPDTPLLRDFDGYRGFDTRWEREIQQMTRMADDRGDGRFYYSGMAQAVLLDRLMPGWKLRAFEDGVWLDDLLAEALASSMN